MADDGPLFIVDNAPGGRSGIEYLRQWCEVAASFDVATGYFDLGALLALDGDWQKLDGMRILMGDQVTARTKKALLATVRDKAVNHLDTSVEAQKHADPFLEGAEAVVAALRDGRIVCRVYNRDKFHAKAYITHGRLEVVGSQALVGSSNFTFPGLTQNVELNLNLESRLEVAQLQEWYERHWRDAVDVTADVLQAVERHTAERPPFEVYAKSLQALVAQDTPASAAWDEHGSRMFPKLDRYQQDAYRGLLEIAERQGGAFLCDGVGLGKTFVGLMLIERLVHDGKRIALFAPKAVKEAVWDKEIRAHLGHIASRDYSALSVFSHTDLSRTADDYPQRFEDVTRLADVVIVDEAHHFRNRGPQPDPDADPSSWSRYHQLARIVRGGDRPKQLFLLTATPINNALSDFRNLIQLWTGDDDARFAQTLGVTSVQARLNQITKRVLDGAGRDEADAGLVDAPDILQDALTEDQLFHGLVVQRSRKYVKESQRAQYGAERTLFPEPQPPSVAAYSLRRSHGKLIELLEESFQKDKPLFSLSIYYPLAFYTGPDESIDPKVENRQRQVVGLIRTNFLKRFESSVHAFQHSCNRLLRRLLAFLKHHEPVRYDRWVRQNEDVLGLIIAPELGEELDESEDVVPPELLEAVEELDTEHYDMVALLGDVLLDLEQLAKLLRVTRDFTEDQDDKLAKLLELLRDNERAGRKTLVFTEFADTARYLGAALNRAGIEAVEQLDGSRGIDRRDVIERFSPYYNGTSALELKTLDRSEIQVLVTTDVLAEGLNLQDATQLINYDIHWNPVKLLQRIGRVDRRLNEAVEARIIADAPHLRAERGKVQVHNFLPPDELEILLRLYQRVAFKTLLISETLGIERSFLKPDDDFEALRELNAKYEGTTTAREELQLELERLLAADPELQARLDALPGAVFSGKVATGAGTFFCYELPALDQLAGAFSLEAGVTRWYLRRADGTVVEELGSIIDLVRCEPGTERRTTSARGDLLRAKRDVEKHIKDTHLRSLNAPLDAPRPRLVGWLDLTESGS